MHMSTADIARDIISILDAYANTDDGKSVKIPKYSITRVSVTELSWAEPLRRCSLTVLAAWHLMAS